MYVFAFENYFTNSLLMRFMHYLYELKRLIVDFILLLLQYYVLYCTVLISISAVDDKQNDKRSCRVGARQIVTILILLHRIAVKL